MIKTLAIICLVILFVGLVFVLLDINKILSEIGVGIFTISLIAFIFIMIFGVFYAIPMIQKTEYRESEDVLEQMAVQNNARIEYVNNYSEVRLVHKYSKKDKVDEWIYYTVKPIDPTETTEE